MRPIVRLLAIGVIVVSVVGLGIHYYTAGPEYPYPGPGQIASDTDAYVGTDVFLYLAPLDSTERRMTTLAHEYTHVLQHDTGAFQRTYRGIRTGDGNARRVYLAVIDRAGEGDYYVDCRRSEPASAALDDDLARRLWRVSADLTGVERDAIASAED